MTELYDKNNNPIEEMYDEDGNPLEEVLSVKEVEQRIADAKEEAKAEFEFTSEQLKTQLGEKEQELKQAQEDLQKAGNKDANFSQLRKSKEEKEEELNIIKKELSEVKQAFSKTNLEANERVINESIFKISDGDKELADKIKFHYNQFVVPSDDTQEKQEERLKSAYTLATGSQAGDILNSANIGSGRGSNPSPASTEKISPDAIEVAKQLGIDEKELRKNKLI